MSFKLYESEKYHRIYSVSKTSKNKKKRERERIDPIKFSEDEPDQITTRRVHIKNKTHNLRSQGLETKSRKNILDRETT